MRLETDTKLDFNNVLIRPKRTVLSSRSQVDLEREFKFPNTKTTWRGVPIISANMDTTGTFGVYEILSKHKIITAMNKHYSLQDFIDYNKNNTLDPDYFMVSSGISNRDFERLSLILAAIECKFICIDVANGYMEALVTYCKRVRETFPNHIIVAGNVVSREMTEELIINGKVDIVKTGIGGGSVYSVDLLEAFPIASSAIELNNELDGLVQLTVTFAYTNWRRASGGQNFINMDIDTPLGGIDIL